MRTNLEKQFPSNFCRHPALRHPPAVRPAQPRRRLPTAVRPREVRNPIHSSTLPDGSSGRNPGGLVIATPDTAFYVSGDTALHADQKLLGDLHYLAFSVLCIGDNFTMGPTDAALAAKWAGTPTAVGVHYDTFPPIEIDHDQAVADFAAQGVTLLLPAIGETIDLG